MQPIKPPNFALQRVREKATALLQLADEIELYGPRQIPENGPRGLTVLLGSGAKPLGSYLRLGLHRFGSWNKETGQCYSYRLNEPFIQRIRDALQVPPAPVLETAKRVDRVFSPSKRAECKRTGSRIYPWWTYMKTEKLQALFLAQFGVMYRYDMQVSQPNIVLQIFDRATQGATSSTSCLNNLPTWRALVSDRTHFRSTLAADVGCSLQEAKDIIQSITNGGYATSSPKNPMCMTLGIPRLTKLQNHPYYIGLRRDYKRIRAVLFPGKKVREIKGELYRAYEKIEDAIMHVVEQHLSKAGVDGWFVHDCVITHDKLNPGRMEAEVQEKTGYRVSFEEETIHSTSAEPSL